MKYIDIHCHLNFDDFNIDREEIIKKCSEKEIGLIVVGTNKKTSELAIKIAEENENIWAIIGLHPVEIPCEIVDGEFDYDTYKKMADHKKVVGIGECGFDYFRNKYGGELNSELQRKVFESQIRIANEVNKPLMLHLRSSLDKKQNAYKDAIEVLKKHAKVNGDTHFFAGNLEEAKGFINLGFRISFTGVITFVRDYNDVVKGIPLNMIMSETDSPYVAPLPYRKIEQSHRNEPTYVVEIAHKIAEIRGEDREMVLQQIVKNAKELFSI